MALNNLKPKSLAQNIQNINTAKNPMNVGANSIGTTTSARQKLLDQSSLTKNTDGISRFSDKANARLEGGNGNNFDILGRKIEASNNILPFGKSNLVQSNNTSIVENNIKKYSADGFLEKVIGTHEGSSTLFQGNPDQTAIPVGQQSQSIQSNTSKQDSVIQSVQSRQDQVRQAQEQKQETLTSKATPIPVGQSGSRQQQVTQEINSKKQEVLNSNTEKKQDQFQKNLAQKQEVVSNRDVPQSVGQSDKVSSDAAQNLDTDKPDISISNRETDNEREVEALLGTDGHVSAQDIAKAFKIHCLSKGNLKTIIDNRGRLALVDQSPEMYEFFVEISTDPQHKKVYDYLLSARDLINRKKLFGFYIKTLNSNTNNEPNRFVNSVSLNYQRPSSAYTEGKSLYFYFNIDAGKCSPSVVNIVTKSLIWYDRHPSNNEDAVPVEIQKLNVYYKQVKGIYFNSKEAYLKAYPEQGGESQNVGGSKAVEDEGTLDKVDANADIRAGKNAETASLVENINSSELHVQKGKQELVEIGEGLDGKKTIGVGQNTKDIIGVGGKHVSTDLSDKFGNIEHKFHVDNINSQKLGVGALVGVTKAGAASVGAGALASGVAAAIGAGSSQGVETIGGLASKNANNAINENLSRGGFVPQVSVGVSNPSLFAGESSNFENQKSIRGISSQRSLRGLGIGKTAGKTVIGGGEESVLIFAEPANFVLFEGGDLARGRFGKVSIIPVMDNGRIDMQRIGPAGRASLARAKASSGISRSRGEGSFGSGRGKNSNNNGNNLPTKRGGWGGNSFGSNGVGGNGGGRRNKIAGAGFPDDPDEFGKGLGFGSSELGEELEFRIDGEPEGGLDINDSFEGLNTQRLQQLNPNNRKSTGVGFGGSNLKNTSKIRTTGLENLKARVGRMVPNVAGNYRDAINKSKKSANSAVDKAVNEFKKKIVAEVLAPLGAAILSAIPWILLAAFFVGLLMVIVIAPYCKPSTPIAPGVTLKSFRDNPLEPVALTVDAIGGTQSVLETAGNVAKLGFNITPAGMIVNAVTGGSVLPASKLRKFIESIPGCDNPADLCAQSGGESALKEFTGVYDCKSQKITTGGTGARPPAAISDDASVSKAIFYYLTFINAGETEGASGPEATSKACVSDINPGGDCWGMYQLPKAEVLGLAGNLDACKLYVEVFKADLQGCRDNYLKDPSIQAKVQMARLYKRTGSPISTMSNYYGTNVVEYAKSIGLEYKSGQLPIEHLKEAQKAIDAKDYEKAKKIFRLVDYYDQAFGDRKQCNGDLCRYNSREKPVIDYAFSTELYEKVKVGCSGDASNASSTISSTTTSSKTSYFDTRQQDQTNKYWSEAFGFPVLAKFGQQIKNPVLTGLQVLDARILAFNKFMGGKVSVEAVTAGGPVVDPDKTLIKSEELAKAFESGEIPIFLSPKESFAQDARDGLEPGLINFLLNFVKPNRFSVNALSVNTHRYYVENNPAKGLSNHSYGASVDINVGDGDIATAKKVGKIIKDAEATGIKLKKWGYANETIKAATIEGGAPADKAFADLPGHLHLDFKGSKAGNGSTGSSSVDPNDPCPPCPGDKGNNSQIQYQGEIFTPAVRAFLDTIAKWEAESADTLSKESYNSGNYVANDINAEASTNLSPPFLKSNGKHPTKNEAAFNVGRYQYFGEWQSDPSYTGFKPQSKIGGDVAAANEGLKKAGINFIIKDFKPTSQDYYPIGKYANIASRTPGAEVNLAKALGNGDEASFKKAVEIGSKEWASMPFFNSSQPKATYDEYWTYFKQRLAVQLKTSTFDIFKMFGGIKASAVSLETKSIRDKLAKLVEEDKIFKIRGREGKEGEINNIKNVYDDNLVKYYNDLWEAGLSPVLGPQNYRGGIPGGGAGHSYATAVDIWGFALRSEVESGGPLKSFDGPTPLHSRGASESENNPSKEGNKSDPRIVRMADLLVLDKSSELYKKTIERFNKADSIAFGSGAAAFAITNDVHLKAISPQRGDIKGHKDPSVYKSGGGFYNGTNGHHSHYHVQFNPSSNGAYKSNSGSGGLSSDCNKPCPTTTTPTQTPTTPPVNGPVNQDNEPNSFLNIFSTVKALAASAPTSFNGLSAEHKKLLGEVAAAIKMGPVAEAGGDKPEMTAAFEKLKADAAGKGFSLVKKSSYRSYDTQMVTFFQNGQSDKIKEYYSDGMSATDRERVKQGYVKRSESSHPPGFSEHHSGLALDIVASNKSASDNLSRESYPEDLANYLADNAPKFGFTLSFGKNSGGANGGAKYEPWHFYFGTRPTTASGSTGSSAKDCPKASGGTDLGANSTLANANPPKNFILTDETGKVLKQIDGGAAVEGASIFKVIVASVVLKKGIDINKQIILDEKSWLPDEEKYTKNQSVTVSKLLFDMLNDSNNTAANALMNQFGGIGGGFDTVAKEMGYPSVAFGNYFRASARPVGDNPNGTRVASAIDVNTAFVDIFKNAGGGLRHSKERLVNQSSYI